MAGGQAKALSAEAARAAEAGAHHAAEGPARAAAQLQVQTRPRRLTPIVASLARQKPDMHLIGGCLKCYDRSHRWQPGFPACIPSVQEPSLTLLPAVLSNRCTRH